MSSVTTITIPDRVTLEIKGAKLNAAIQNALRRRRQPGGGYDTSSDAKNMHDQNTTIDQNGGRQHSLSSGPKSPESLSTRDVGFVKEAALLKATIESLRAGIREKEDAVIDLEREKETLVEQVARLDFVSKENTKLSQKVFDMETQAEKLKSKLAQAEAGQALTMKLVETLKSAQNDLRTAHGQVAQRCSELENMTEDSKEAIRRGENLLHSQQLKIGAQSRQLNRQEEDLKALREERELQLKKADHHAAELAQVLRRERAGQGCIADAKAEVEALKEELEKTRDTFARQRLVMRKNQEVIDTQEKAVQDARSELLSLSLEAEKQSARHQEAAADAVSEISSITSEKDAALRESRVVRLEKDDLKAQLEEAVRKRDEAIAAAAAGKNSTIFAGRSRVQRQQLASPSFLPSPSTASDENSSREHQGLPFGSSNSSTQHRNHASNGPVCDKSSDQSKRQSTDPFSGQLPQRPVDLSPRTPGQSFKRPVNRLSDRVGASCRTSKVRSDANVQRDTQGSTETSAADAGGGGRGGNDRPIVSGVGRSDTTDSEKILQIDKVGGRTNGDDKLNHSTQVSVETPQHRQREVAAKLPMEASRAAREEVQEKSRGGVSVDRGSSPRPFDIEETHEEMFSKARGGRKVGDITQSNVSDDGVGRKRARTLVQDDVDRGVSMSSTTRSQGSDVARSGQERIEETTPAQEPMAPRQRRRPEILASKQVSRSRVLIPSSAPPGEEVDRSVSTHAEASSLCPCCGDTPYGLMINCRSCGRQHHSSCVPEGQRVGKGLGVVFYCVRCSKNNGQEG